MLRDVQATRSTGAPMSRTEAIAPEHSDQVRDRSGQAQPNRGHDYPQRASAVPLDLARGMPPVTRG